ncbi:permease-like cell division protein FtsX [Fusibacter tunisiensis]|uniref:Cell division protein FtsX n=1 Tax=Fusibacter tunisiensis TaxID=1008308 RepID=A0ABS2MRA7_9FIRM|nr:permease-like cell division protein FtsX [Fusibacter tunisiensis]MBM7561937.1 cell division transport system permease protein [Fusibacter tunisiensis]
MTIKPIFTLKEAIKGLWRNRMMSVASVSSVAATLIILGIIFALIININSVSQSAKDQFDSIQAYLDDSVEAAQIEGLKEELEAIEGVSRVLYESKTDALNRMMESWDENAYLLEGLEENPLPNSLIVYLTDIYYAESVLELMASLEGIEEIKSYQDIVETLLSVTEMVRKAGMLVIFVLIAISTFIIHNTIKLTVNSRKREINIMKYVGATNWFIRWPFLMEGTLLGLLGAGVAAGIVKLGYDYLYQILGTDFYAIISVYIIRPEVMMPDVIFLFVVIGAGIGALGSIWSMRKYLNV